MKSWAVLVVLLLAMVISAHGAVNVRSRGVVRLQESNVVSGGKPVVHAWVQNPGPTSATIVWSAPASGRRVIRVTESGGSAPAVHEEVCAARTELVETKVSGLTPGLSYTYEVVCSGATHVCKGVLRKPPAPRSGVEFAVYGDSRSHPEAHGRVASAIAKESGVDFVLHTGDFVGSGEREDLWFSEFIEPAQPLIKNLPLYPVLGNHEGKAHLYFDIFALLGNERYYSFVRGNVYVAALDSNSSLSPGSEQYESLVKDLGKHKAVPWKFILMHHPPFSSGPHGKVDGAGQLTEKPMRVAREVIPGIARAYGVSAVFAGHDHFYERSSLEGCTYITTGGGGAPGYDKSGAADNPYSQKLYVGSHYCVVDVVGNVAKIMVKKVGGGVVESVRLSVPKTAPGKGGQ